MAHNSIESLCLKFGVPSQISGITAYLVIFLLGYLCATFFWRFFWWHRSIKRFRSRSRSVIRGQVSEQLAPYLPEFPYEAADAKFIGKPIDFIIFDGLNTDEIEQIVFVEVKSGSSPRLTKNERAVRDCIRNGKVAWYEYKVPTE